MKYHDSMATAQDKMTRVCLFLEQHKLVPIPINYHVAYAYISDNHPALKQAINGCISNKTLLDNFLVESWYNEYLSFESKNQDTLIKGVDQVVNKISHSTSDSHEAVNQYLAHLDSSLVGINESNLPRSRQIISSLIDATYALKGQQQQLQETLLQAQAETEKTRIALDQLRKIRYTDPLTGLFQYTYLDQKVTLWKEQHQSLCAITIDLDHFNDFNQKYGHLIGDIVLSKVAKKVQSYVLESGIPVRNKGEEFLIVLPDITQATANEIAEKIRNGIEKLRFISSRSGKRLPSITVSVGVAHLPADSDLTLLTYNAQQAMEIAKKRGRNTVANFLN